MLAHGLAFLFTLLIWWLSTGVILVLCTRSERTFGRSFLGGSLMLVAALYGLVETAAMTDARAAYLAFLCALGVWGWLEMSFLMGFVTGPRRTDCPADATGWHRFRLALETLLYHELAIAAAFVLILWLTWGEPNQTATWSFAILMAMRISAKLNIFLGVPNLSDQLLPKRLHYLKSYFRKRSFNALFPVSVLGTILAAVSVAQGALGASEMADVGAALLLTLLSLGILEHFFMILPLPDAALWHWTVPSGNATTTDKREA